MKKKFTWILIAVLLVVGIVGAGGLYNHLSEEHKGNQLQEWDGIPFNPPVQGNSGGDPIVPPEEPDPIVPPEEPDPVVPPEEPDPVVPPEEPDPIVPPEEPDPIVPPEEPDPVVPPEEEEPPKPPVTLQVPDFTVLDENGKEVKLSDFAGKPIVLNFWATWCYYCKQEMPAFDRAYKENPDVQFLMVNATDGQQETVAGVKKYLAENGFSFDVFFDTKGEALYNYGVNAFPMTFFINAKGEPVAYASGMLDYETLLQGIAMIKE